MPNIKYRIELEGGEQVRTELLTVEQAVKRLQDAAESGTGADTFASTTAAISTLGSTTQEALGAAAAAAQKFGASANELARVEGIIKALDKRAQDGGFSFQTLAQNYDKARAAALRLGQGIQSAETGFAALGRAVSGIGAVAVGAFVGAQQQTIAFAQSIAKISAAAINLGVSFQEFDAARKKLEALGTSADAISSGFDHVQQQAERMRLEQIGRDAESVKQGFSGSGAALERLKKTAQEFTVAGDAAAAALRSLGMKIPGVAEKDIQKYGIELAKLIALIERLSGKKVDIDFSADPVQQLQEIKELIEQMPPGAERTAAALKFLGKSLGTETLQQLQLMEGSLPPIEANALLLTQALNRMYAAWARFGSVSIAPFITAEINAVTGAIEGLQTFLDNFSWSTFTDAATAAGNALKYFTAAGLTSLGLQWAWDLGGFDALIDKLKNATQAWLEYFGIASKAGGTPLPGGAPIGGPGGGIGGAARGGLLGGRGTGTSDSNLAWLSRGEYIMPARAVRQPGVLAFLEALRRSGGIPGYAGGGGGIPGYAGGGEVRGRVDNLVNSIISSVNQIDTVWRSFASAFFRLEDNLAQIQESIIGQLRSVFSGQITRNARGGLLGGRGTGTSDSNLAWLSRGEHIMPARAVRQPGVLAFLEALRRSGGNLADVLDGMGRFALGGMVPRAAIPAFAAGGLNRGMSNVTIQFPGLSPISGLRASSDVVDQLHRAAAMAQVRSGGRKPSRYS